MSSMRRAFRARAKAGSKKRRLMFFIASSTKSAASRFPPTREIIGCLAVAPSTRCKLREQHRFMKGLFTWIGYPQKGVPYRRDSRYAGETKWNYWRLWNFALEGVTSFTIGPLKIATYLGLATAVAAFVYAGIIIAKTLLYGEPVAGYPSLMVVILFLGGVQLITVGIMGEYIGRMFDESKQRPLYFVNRYEPSGSLHSVPREEATTT